MIESQSLFTTKYYKCCLEESLRIQLKENYHLDLNNLTNQEIILCLHKKKVVGFLTFMNYCYLSEDYDSKLVIFININEDYDVKEIIEKIYTKLFLISRMSDDLIIIPDNNYKQYLGDFNLDLVYEDERHFFVRNPFRNLKRLVVIGDLPTGLNNNIGDVKGVKVGHSSINNEEFHTGVTSILAHSGNIFKEKVPAATFVFNGFGKSVGTMQINELGTIETPILLTNTLNVSVVSDALVEYALNQNPEIGITTSTVNPAVFECNDGKLNNIRHRIIKHQNVYEAIKTASKNFAQGNIGAGSGMRCHGFKGGIGSSSRVVTINNKSYTIGVLVNSNFNGHSSSSLIFKGRKLGKIVDETVLEFDDTDGSIIVVIATDLPLDSRQLGRICKRSSLGVGKTGSFVSNGSGDVYVAFSTKNKISHYPEKPFTKVTTLHDDFLEIVFKATVEATEEAILNSMLYSQRVIGYNNLISKSINEYIELFDDLLIDKII